MVWENIYVFLIALTAIMCSDSIIFLVIIRQKNCWVHYICTASTSVYGHSCQCWFCKRLQSPPCLLPLQMLECTDRWLCAGVEMVSRQLGPKLSTAVLQLLCHKPVVSSRYLWRWYVHRSCAKHWHNIAVIHIHSDCILSHQQINSPHAIWSVKTQHI